MPLTQKIPDLEHEHRESNPTAALPYDVLQKISAAVVKAMNAHDARDLSQRIPTLKSLSPDEAQNIVDSYAISPYYLDTLFLDGLDNLSAATAAKLSAHNGRSILLRSLKSIDLSVAQAFSSYNGILSFDGLRRIDPKPAESLSQRDPTSELQLFGLDVLDEEESRMLARYKGALFLDFRVATDAATAHFVDYSASRLIIGNRALSAAPFQLAQYLKSLGGYTGNLHLFTGREIEQGVAQCLGSFTSKSLHFPHYVCHISVAAAKALSRFPGELHFADSINGEKGAIDILKNRPVFSMSHGVILYKNGINIPPPGPPPSKVIP